MLYLMPAYKNTISLSILLTNMEILADHLLQTCFELKKCSGKVPGHIQGVSVFEGKYFMQ